MIEKAQQIANSPAWYRKILNAYWVIVLWVLADELIILFAYHKGDWAVFRPTLYQILILAAAMAVTELICLFKPLVHDYTVITAGIAFASIIIWYHPEIPVVPASLLLSLFVSSVTFRKSRVLWAGILNLVAFTILLLLVPELKTYHTGKSLISIYSILTAAAVLSLLIVERGRQTLMILQEAYSAHEKLFVQNIIMDKLYKTDALTELYNHKTFHEYLEKLIEQSETNGLSLQLAIIDLDNFKKVNDTYGHHVGDIVLMRTAAVLRGAVTPHDFVARYGGEEFAIIFTDNTISESYRVLERIRAEMEALLHEELGFRSVTCSIGLEDYKKGTGKDSLFQYTDTSLYAAKKRGKNQISSTELPAILEQTDADAS